MSRNTPRDAIAYYGLHAIQHLLNEKPHLIREIWYSKENPDRHFEDILQTAVSKKISIHQVTTDQLDRVTKGVHQSLIAWCAPLTPRSESELENFISHQTNPLLLILDGVQDPHNLGACLRVADAAGVTAVIFPKDKAVGLTPTVVKVASGAAHKLPIFAVTNLARCLRQLQSLGVWLYGFSDHADKTFFEADFKGACGLILGSEGKGMRQLTEKHCDVLYRIPMLGVVESLNVSVATGIVLYESVRQRR